MAIKQNMKNPFSAVTGYVPDSFDPRDVWVDEVLAGDETQIPPKYLIEGLRYECQYSLPFCVSFATTTMIEYHYAKRGTSIALSQPHLFFHSGGGPNGSSFRPNLNTAKSPGCIKYDKCPMPEATYGADSAWLELLKPQVLSIPFEDTVTITGYARVTPDTESLQRAIMQHGPILVGVAAGGDYYSGKGKRTKKTDNHAVLLVGWTPESWVIFDSLNWVRKSDGYGTLDRSYTFQSAYVVTELPGNWKEVRDTVRSEPYANALNHYGKRRDFEAEQQFAAKMLDEFKKFNNQSVLEAAGRWWSVMCNAGVYGDYSLSYRKYGVWQPGDLINFVYHWRRTGEYLFDLNEPRKK